MHLLPDEILETIKMVDLENLDIRTVTMGISLLENRFDGLRRIS